MAGVHVRVKPNKGPRARVGLRKFVPPTHPVLAMHMLVAGAASRRGKGLWADADRVSSNPKFLGSSDSTIYNIPSTYIHRHVMSGTCRPGLQHRQVHTSYIYLIYWTEVLVKEQLCDAPNNRYRSYIYDYTYGSICRQPKISVFPR